MKPVLSICIVVRNAAADLALTLASLDRQREALTLLGSEVVLVDGQSTDLTPQVASRWIQQAWLPVHFLVQPPRGIYPAMNLACSEARGDWLIYVNAGDLLLNATPLVLGISAASSENLTSIQFESAMFVPGAARGLWLPGRYLACHQALVYQKKLHDIYGPYNEQLMICSDRLFDLQSRALGRLNHPGLVAATQVSPANTSRDPLRFREDLSKIKSLGLSFRPVARPWLSLLILTLEKAIGFSLTVWIRLYLLRLVGQARMVLLV